MPLHRRDWQLHWRAAALTVAASLVSWDGLHAQDAPAPPEEIAAFVAQVAELQEVLDTEFDQDALTKAAGKAQELLSREQVRKPPSPLRIAQALDWSALLQAHLGNAAAAKKAADDQIALTTTHFGKDSWQAASAKARAKYVDAALRLSPEQRQLIHNTYGQMHEARELMDTGVAADALTLAKPAQVTWRALLGADHVLVALAARDVGEYAVTAGKADQAKKWLTESVASLTRLLGKDHPETLVARRHLGLALAFGPTNPEAEPILREVLEAEQKLHGEEDLNTAACYFALGVVHNNRARFALAAPFLAKAVDIRTRLLGEGHIRTLESLEQQAANFQGLGQFANAERCLLTLLAAARKSFGQTHLATALALRELGTLYGSMEDFDRAERFFNESLVVLRKLEIPPGIQTALGMWILGENEIVQGHYARADQRITQALELARKSLPKNSPVLSPLEVFQAFSRHCLGRYDEAIVL